MIDLNLTSVSLRAKSRLTERSQTTIPAAIRDALHLKPGETIEYSLLADGNVIMSRQTEPQDDPVVSQFLAFLEKDMRENPRHIYPAPVALWNKINELIANIDIDLDAPLTDE